MAEQQQAAEPDEMANMMKELEQMMDGEGFEEMFGGLMNNLASRDLLYEPMKDLRDKVPLAFRANSTEYPDWLRENQDSISNDDLVRFRKQHLIVSEIVACFDSSSEAEPNEEDSKRLLI